MNTLVINRTLEKRPRRGPGRPEEQRGHAWAHSTGRATAGSLHGVARAPAAPPPGAPE